MSVVVQIIITYLQMLDHQDTQELAQQAWLVYMCASAGLFLSCL